jgi:FlaA1/EpsC-like NDP-sugar epimerase
VNVLPANAIDWHSFLARPRLPAPSDAALGQLRYASILVTGAGGSIGNALSMRLAALHPRRLLLLDASEQALYRLQSSLNDVGLLTHARLILGNCNDSPLLEDILEPRQLIFHAAAYKHVPLLEHHPLEAIANNTLATLTLSGSASRAGAARIVLLSTDKAAAPASILGATKRIAERIVLAHDGIALRLANVLGTEGSVSETFARQIAAGSPITVTTSDARRYFLTGPEAVDLLLASAIAAPARTLLAPQLAEQHSIAELAQFLSNQFSPLNAAPIVFTGHRPGDKPREVFWSSDEQPSRSSIAGMIQIHSSPGKSELAPHTMKTLCEAVGNRDLPLAIECIARIVPGYSPSETIIGQIKQCEAIR